MVHSSENTIGIQFVMVPLVKVRKLFLKLEGRLGWYRRPEQKNVSWLASSKIFQKNKEVRLFAVCVVKWRILTLWWLECTCGLTSLNITGQNEWF